MFKNRCLLIGLMLLIAACVAVVALALLPTRPGVTKENFDRIEVGMTRAEVVRIFGCEANGEECSGHRIPFLWDNGDGQALVRFDENDRVTETAWWPGWPDERPLWERWLDRLLRRERPPPCMDVL
jgi:hypothetical protein